MTMRHRVAALLSTMAAVGLLAGCAADHGEDPSSAPTTRETSSSPRLTSEASTTNVPTVDVPAFPEGTVRQTGEASGVGNLVLVDVRVAEAEAFDRIVLEFSGTGTPGWVVNYVDRAQLDGSGEVVDLGGTAILDIYASGTTWPAPDYYRGPSHFASGNGGGLNDIHVGGTFEGTTQVLAGVDEGPAPFRAFVLTEPSRLVVDVAE